MWQCENCGYTDEDGTTFEVEVDEDNPEESVRYCPECGSDEVYQVDDGEEEDEEEEEEAAEEEEGFEEGDDWEGEDYEEDESEW
jgi:hypothetical protein